MKTPIALCAFLFLSSALAGDYKYLIPQYPITLQEARGIIPLVDAEKAKIGAATKALEEQRSAITSRLVQKKDVAIQAGRQKIDACNKEAACVAQANQQLATEIGSIHSEIAAVNEKFEPLLAKAKEQAEADLRKLTHVLAVLKHAVTAHVIESEFAKKNGRNGIVIETGLILKTLDGEKETKAYLNQNVENIGYWDVSDRYLYTFATYFFRTPTEQKRVVVRLAAVFDRDYDDVRKKLLAPNAETAKEIFGVSKSALGTKMIEEMNYGHPFNDSCLGTVKSAVAEPGICVVSLKLDKVLL